MIRFLTATLVGLGMLGAPLAQGAEPGVVASGAKVEKRAGGFDMKITAEGIETEEHARRAANLGCDYAQGFLFGRPIPQTSLAAVVITEFAEYIKTQQDLLGQSHDADMSVSQPSARQFEAN